jgi:hypothetical protein
VIFENTSLVASGNETFVIIQLDNQQGKDIYVDGVACSSKPPGNLGISDVTPYPNGPSTMNAGSSTDITLPCTDANGKQVVMAPGSSFTGSIGVTYNYVDEVSGAPQRLAVATLTGTVQSG